MDARAYQLEELRIARDPSDPRHLLPPIGPTHRRVLDLGCGAAQTFIARDPGPDRLAVGLDVDGDALKLARELAPRLLLVRGTGETLPFLDGSFDYIASRVALPYMDLRVALREIDRVLSPAGELWCTLHPFRLTLGELGANLRRFQLRGAVYRLLVLANGVLLHFTGRALWGGETFQTTRGIRQALVRAGFPRDRVHIDQGRFMIATARK